MNKQIKVLITSADSGGGHVALRRSLVETFGADKNLIIKEYHSGQKTWQTIYEMLVKIPILWENVVKYGDKPPFRYINSLFVTLPEAKNAIEILEDFEPDIVISTMTLQTGVFYDLRKKYDLKYILVSAVPDIGDQESLLLLSHEADFYLVRNEYTLNCLKNYVDEKKLIIYGTKVSDVFTKVKNLTSTELNLKFHELIEKNFPGRKPNDSYKNIVVVGGSGWTYKSRRLIEKLSSMNIYNIFVICGHDQKFIEEILFWENVYPFGFIDQEELAVIEMYCDAAILSSLAPATMFELMTLNKYPLFVHRHIKGQETPHLQYIADENIGIYKRKRKEMVALLEDYFRNPEKYSELLRNAERLMQIEKEKVKGNSKIIENIYR